MKLRSEIKIMENSCLEHLEAMKSNLCEGVCGFGKRCGKENQVLTRYSASNVVFTEGEIAA